MRSLRSLQHTGFQSFLWGGFLFVCFHCWSKSNEKIRKQKTLTAQKKAVFPFRAFHLNLALVASQPATGLGQKTEGKCLRFTNSASECSMKASLDKSDSTSLPREHQN